MPFLRDTVSFTEARALLWLTVLWSGSCGVWSELIALWSGAPRPVSGRWEFGLYPDQGAGGSLSSPAVALLISATDEKAQEKDLL